MAVAKRRQRELTPNERVRELQVDDRASRAPMRMLDDSWVNAARAWSRQHGFILKGVLDLFDHVASTYYYFGDTWEAAQARAWPDTMEIMCPTT